MAVLEAAACGCPVVGTDVGILPELHAETDDRPLATPGDAQALATLLLSLLDNPDRRQQLVREQAGTLQQWELSAATARFRRCLERLIGQPRGTG